MGRWKKGIKRIDEKLEGDPPPKPPYKPLFQTSHMTQAHNPVLSAGY